MSRTSTMQKFSDGSGSGASAVQADAGGRGSGGGGGGADWTATIVNTATNAVVGALIIRYVP